MAEIIQVQDSRRTFIDTLCELAETDKNIMLLIMDTGFNYIEKFKDRFPKQFKNLGTTEPFSMVYAAGLSLRGRNVWIYSMIPFVTFRCHEQIRNAVIKHNTSVKILGVKGSKFYGFLGFSHNMSYPSEDTDFCKNVGLNYCIPNSLEEVKNVIIKEHKSDKPCYIRL